VHVRICGSPGRETARGHPAFKNELIDLLDASKFGTKEYTPYEVYTKALGR
jgi:hypothetical protein